MTYTTIEKTFRDNGDRHARKAAYWRALGKPDYAEGSMRKAERNWKRADVWKIPEYARPMYEATKDLITRQIYTTGTGGDPFTGVF